MRSWLAYSGAFACAVGVALLCYLAAFYVIMTGYGYGFAGFVLMAVVGPVLAGLATFGVTHALFSTQRFAAQGWAYGAAFVAATTAVCFGLLAADLLEEPQAALLLVAILFVGGRLMIARSANA